MLDSNGTSKSAGAIVLYKSPNQLNYKREVLKLS